MTPISDLVCKEASSKSTSGGVVFICRSLPRTPWNEKAPEASSSRSVIVAVSSAEEERLRRENVTLREEIDKAAMFEEIVGTSPASKSVLLYISKVAPTDSTVLITGQTGTGKELVARAIHRRSDRASRAFVSVNCAAIPRDLIASELFGHEKGAFTGAIQQRLGRFASDGGIEARLSAHPLSAK